MDPLAMAGSAMGALNSYRAQLDSAKLALEEGKQLQRAINIFEVTVNMIPPRGDKKKIAEMTGTNEKKDVKERNSTESNSQTQLVVPSDTSGSVFNVNQHVQKTLEIIESSEATEFVKQQAQSVVLDAIGNAVQGTPLGDESSTSPLNS